MGTFLPGVPLKKKKKSGRWRREDDVETLISLRFRLFSEERKVKLEPERRRRRRVTPAEEGLFRLSQVTMATPRGHLCANRQQIAVRKS